MLSFNYNSCTSEKIPKGSDHFGMHFSNLVCNLSLILSGDWDTNTTVDQTCHSQTGRLHPAKFVFMKSLMSLSNCLYQVSNVLKNHKT